MDVIFSDRFIVRRIFDFLPITDVFQCRLVNKLWFKEAARQINKCAPKDICIIFSENERIKGHGDPSEDITEDDSEWQSWWYIRRASNFSYIEYDDIHVQMKKFFETSMKCFPSISLLCYDPSLESLIEEINPSTPTLKIRRNAFTIYPITAATELPIGETCQCKCIQKCTDIEAIHINRFLSDHKITITDWADPESVRPNLEDQEYPVKAIIFLSSGKDKDRVKHYKSFVNFTSKCPQKVSGGIILSGDDNLSFIDTNQKQWKQSPTISIAFAGKGIKSNIFAYSRSPSPSHNNRQERMEEGREEEGERERNEVGRAEEERIEGEQREDGEEEEDDEYDDYVLEKEFFSSILKDFKQHLDFSLDDGRVFGFLYSNQRTKKYLDFPEFCGEVVWNLLLKEFPQVNIIRFDMVPVHDADVCLHLIKI